MTCSKYWIFMSNFPAVEPLISRRINNNIFLETSKSLCIPLYPLFVLGAGLVRIVTRQHVDNQWIMVCPSRGSKFLSSLLCADQLWGPLNILLDRGWGGPFSLSAMCPRFETDHGHLQRRLIVCSCHTLVWYGT